MTAGASPSERRQQVLMGLAGTLLSAVLLWWTLRGTDWVAVRALVAHSGAAWVLLALVGQALAVVGRALMWRVLLTATAPVSVWQVTRAMIIGLTVNNILPARIGEPVRAAVIALWANRSMVAVVATVFAETMTSAVLLVGIGTLALSHSGSLPWFTHVSIPLGLACLVALVAMAVLARRPPAPGRGRLGAIIGRIRIGSLALARPTAVLRMLAWGSLSIGGQALVLWAAARAIALDLSVAAIVLTVVAMNVAGSLPSAPAALGTLEFGALGALALFAVPRTEAVSVTLLFHTLVCVPVTVVGVVLLSRLGVGVTHVRELVSRAQRVMAKPEA